MNPAEEIKVYKFGGASVATPAAVAQLKQIVAGEQSPLFVVISAMGKTTNALERVFEAFMAPQKEHALALFEGVKQAHLEMITDLFAEPSGVTKEVKRLFSEVEQILTQTAEGKDYSRWYDRLVSYGELFSTVIVSAYLSDQKIPNRWIDMRKCLVTDGRFQEANIDTIASQQRLKEEISLGSERIWIAQGFIGATLQGEITTLGREGSDYTAGVVANLLEAHSATIWKDVEGILNADPRLFLKTVLIPELTYLDAIELAYSGAQVIHPKTIKPLQNKNIPLYVRSFQSPQQKGSVICAQIKHPITTPILILKQNQLLISIRPKDFSFVLEERLSEIFSIFETHRQKINLIQSSAVNLTLLVNHSHNIEEVIERLHDNFRVAYNDLVEMLTIRFYDPATYRLYADSAEVILIQKTRRTVRLIRRVKEH